jgi:hypothetical protein
MRLTSNRGFRRTVGLPRIATFGVAAGLHEVVVKARQAGVLQLQQQKIAKDRSRSSLGCRNISEFQAQVAAAMVPNQLS